jgi:phospholipid/cholesterol/gamma-HCH transport system substrate-binding protein
MRRKKFKISIIALIILFAVFLLFLLVSWKMGFFDEKSHYYELKATFENISGLKKKSPVWFRGEEVGYVKEIISSSDEIEVIFLIESGIKVPKGSIATISAQGLFGEKYLEIIPPNFNSGDILKQKSVLPGKTTVSLTDLGEKGEISLEEMRIALRQVQEFLVSLNKIIGDEEIKRNAYKIGEIEDEIQGVMVSARVLVDNLNEIVGDSLLKSNLKATITNLKNASIKLDQASEKIETTADNINQIFGDNKVQEIVSDLEELTKDIKEHPWKLLRRR